jgi:hypothetical protein
MKSRILFGAVAVAAALVSQGANAEGDAGPQVSAFGGKQRLRIDRAWGVAASFRFD